MKKFFVSAVVLLALASSVLPGCGSMGGSQGSNVLGSILGALGNENTVTSVADLVIGAIKIDQSQLVGTWKYAAPGCAFTSENLLAKAGGAAVAAQIKTKLEPTYKQVGINSSNTYFTFTQDGNFQAKINGIPWNGTYTYDAASGTLKMKSLLLSSTAFITRTTKGLSLNFESKKLLTLLQAVSSLSGNSSLETIGELSKNYDGVRLGFDMSK